MSPEQARFLTLWHLPGVFDKQQTAWYLGVPIHCIAIIVSNRDLKPLGKPAQNGNKVFAREDVLGLARDRDRLDRLIESIQAHWQDKNERRGP